MQEYLESVEQVFTDTKSSMLGLSSEEAAKRLAANGKNKLAEPPKESMIKRFFDQMKDPMIIMLLVAAVISAITEIYEAGWKFTVPWDTIIILFVVIMNAILGLVQESKAEKAIEALQEMSAAMSKVLRDGKIVSVKSEDLVVGDVVLLEAGDSVPADCRIFECASMKVEESALTGESVPVNKLIDILNLKKDEKDIPLGDRKNMLYMGSDVVYGHGKAVVVATGMQTEMGKIADALAQAEEELTPLQIKLAQLSRILTKIVIGICAFIFAFRVVMALINGLPINIDLILDSFMIAVSLAVAAIPEGLVAVVTISLSIGVTNMSKKNAIIRKMSAVETLGCTQIICSDKTGTLTQNVMTVVEDFGSNEKMLAAAMALCNDAKINEEKTVNGEPTEAALVKWADAKVGCNKNALEKAAPRVGEAPFDSARKMMSTVHYDGTSYIQYTKGAPDVLLRKCKYCEVNGETVEMTSDLLRAILAENKRMADKALRVLAAAYKSYPGEPDSYDAEYLEEDLTFVGLCGMIDPVRPEVKDAIEECRTAGITPIMITGDHRDTAIAIAKQLGMITSEDQAMTGAQLEEIPDDEFDKVVDHIRVYARVQPEHKTRIVKAWRQKGYITAMTGDGVNDAPSIKSADIGVGMGITGTDVTKNVADMVLADDNFATIVNAVSEGRRVYDNIRKAIQFLLGSNMAEVLCIFIATLLNFTVLKSVHLLFINLVTDCFPALALAFEKPEKDIMYRKPRKSTDGIFAGGMGIDCIYQGFITTVLTLAAYIIGVNTQNGALPLSQWRFTNFTDEEGMIGMTMAFLTLSMTEIFHSFNMRSQRGSVLKMSAQGLHNGFLFLSMIASLVVTALVIEPEPIARIFGFHPLDWQHYLIALALAISILPIVEIIKLFQRMAAKKK